MKKNQFKASSTLRLARTFLQKHKVMTTWRANDTMNALEEVTDDLEDQDEIDQTQKAIVGNTSTAKARAAPFEKEKIDDSKLSQNKEQEVESFSYQSAALKQQA